jgi:transcriptional regulator GlxA family with amidase domain
MKIGLIAFDQCMTSVVAGFVDTFGLASRASEALSPDAPTAFETVVVTASGRAVTGSGGFAIQAGGSLVDFPRVDVVVVPPIMGDISTALGRESDLLLWLNTCAQQTRILCSVCTGAFFFAEAGLLDGKRATTNPLFSEMFQRWYPNVQLVAEERIVDQQSIICAGSNSAFLDLVIYLVDRFAGHDVAVWTAKAVSRGTDFESQRPYFLFVARRDHGDAAILALQDWMQLNFATAITADLLADHGALSIRSLTRRFRAATGLSPMDYLRRLRVEASKRLLDSTDTKIEQVGGQVGYEDARSFARSFNTAVGMPPSAYRRRFQKHEP